MFEEKKYQDKSAGDVISRIKRVNKLVKVPEKINLEIISGLENYEEVAKHKCK